MFSKLAVAAVLSTLLAVATAVPTYPGADHCNTGSLHCCNTDTSKASHSEGEVDGILPIVFNGITTNVAAHCSPITALGIAGGNTCQSTPICCENNSVGDVVSVGCAPIILS